MLLRIASRMTTKGLVGNFVVGRKIIRAVEIDFVDFIARHEGLDVDRMRTLDRLLGDFSFIERDVIVLADFVAANHFVALDDVARHGIDILLSKPVAVSRLIR